jgi:alkylation response protein AidB-like acyl-CoA dehydrogenase
MDFSFTEAAAAVSELARKIFGERVTPASLRAAEADPAWFDRKLWADLAAAGLLGTSIPEAYGGSGHGLGELCALLVEAGARVAPVPLWPVLALGALPVAAHGTSAQRERWLPGVASGDVLLTAALAEENALDPLRPETRTARDGNGFTLEGRKICVPAAHLASRVLVPARSDDGAVGIFLVDPTAHGVAFERQTATTGEPQFHLTLGSARVDRDDVLVLPGARGHEALAWMVERATVALCALELGVAEQALQMTATYTSNRKQFDRPVATFQAVSQRAADAYIDVEAMRLTLWKAAFELDAGIPASQAVAVAKIWAAEAGHHVVYAAQHLHGGIGFDREYPLHRHYLWSKQIELTLGAASVHLARLGAAMAEAAP